MKRLFGLLYLLLCPLLLFSKDFGDALVEQALAKYNMLERFNNANEARSQQYRNEFVIELDPDWVPDPNWIEERPDKELIKSQYDGLSAYLRKFNNERTDGLRFYVVVINNYYAEIKETIEVVTLTEEITNLSQLVKFPDNEEQLKRFKTDVASIPAQISNALAKEYSDRVVYFYGKIKLFNLSGPKEYKHDNLTIVGDQISPLKDAIIARAKSNLMTGDSEGNTIENIVFNIANSIQIMYDGEGPGTSLFACSQSLEELVTQTQSIYEKEYANEVKSITQILDNPSSDQQHKGSRYVLGGSPRDFNETDLFNYDILLDKVALLNASSNNLKLYVVFKEVGFAMPAGDWEKMAKDVYEASSVAKQSGNLILIVPYLPVQCTEEGFLGINTSVGVGMLMPAVYCTDANEGLRKEMNSVLSIRANTWQVNFNQAFSKIPKKHVAYRFKLLYNNDLMFLGAEQKENVTGYADIFEVELWEDTRAYKLSESGLDYSLCNSGTANGTVGASYVDYEAQHNCLEAYAERNEAILATAPDWKRVTETNLRQLTLTESRAKTFANWYALHKRYGVIASLDAPDDEYFYGGRNPVKVEDMLLLIDAGSTVASVIGADALFDGIGAYYAYDNGKYVEAYFYAAAVAIPLMNGATRRMIMDGGAYTLKTLKGSYVTVPKGVLGMNYVARIEQGFSQFSRQTLNMKSFSKAAQYKTDVKFVTALEEGMLADGGAIKKLNANPDLVEEFYQFHSAGKGDLAKFLNSRWYDFLPDGLKVDITNTPALKTAFENASPEVRAGMVEAWKILDKADSPLKNNVQELSDVSKHLNDINNFDGYDNWRTRTGRSRHSHWIYIDNISGKILARKSHVLEIEGLDKVRNYQGNRLEGFTGCHSIEALNDFVAANGGTYQIKNKPLDLIDDQVFIGQPVILKDGKEYVKTNGRIVEFEPGKFGGTSTFFPENWDNARILEEVEYAIKNNHGVAPGDNPSEYFGFSKNGKVEIHFYLSVDGTIDSYFPKL